MNNHYCIRQENRSVKVSYRNHRLCYLCDIVIEINFKDNRRYNKWI